MTADRLTEFARTVPLCSDSDRAIIMALCAVAKAAYEWDAASEKCTDLGYALRTLSAALAEPTTDQKERR